MARTALALSGDVIAISSPPKTNLIVSLTDDVTPAQAQSAVNQVCVALARHSNSVTYCRVVLGGLMLDVQDRQLFKPDFKSFQAYMRGLEEKHGLSRSVIQDAMLFSRTFPKVQPKEVEDAPIVNLTLAARAARNSEPKEAREILKDASRLSIVAYREKLVEKKYIPPQGRPDGGNKKTGNVNLLVNGVGAKIATLFRERGGDNPGKYLAYLLSLDKQEATA